MDILIGLQNRRDCEEEFVESLPTKTSKRLVSHLLEQALFVTLYYLLYRNCKFKSNFKNCEYGTGNRSCIVGRGPVPRHAWVPERSRGTGPRATGWVHETFARDRPSRYGNENPDCRVGRGPVPRHAWVHRTFARDRPSRYGLGGTLDSRGTGSRCGIGNRSCLVGRGPVPRHAWGSLNVREGQALALRAGRRFYSRFGTNTSSGIYLTNISFSGKLRVFHKFIPPLRRGRIGPTSVVRERLLPNGSDQASLTYRGDKEQHRDREVSPTGKKGGLGI